MTTRFRLLLVVGLLVLLGLTAPSTVMADVCSSVAGNLVSNCGFETGDFTDWTHSGTTSYTLVGTSNVNSGSYSAQIGPYTYSGLSSISQTIGTGTGSYDLTFYLAHGGNCSGQTDCSEALVEWNGTTLLDELNAGPYAYEKFTYDVSATGPSTLTFGFATNPNYYYLDDISVVSSSVPEPSSMFLLGIGLMGLGGLTRRKILS